MRKKKSYMNKENILEEGFFSALSRAFGKGGNAAVQRKIDKLKKSAGKDKKKLDKLQKDYKKMVTDFDKKFEKEFGVKLAKGDTIEDLIDYGEKRFGKP